MSIGKCNGCRGGCLRLCRLAEHRTTAADADPRPYPRRRLGPRRRQDCWRALVSAAVPEGWLCRQPTSSARGCRSSSCSRRCVPATLAPVGYQHLNRADAWQRNVSMCGQSPSLESVPLPPRAQSRDRRFARTDDVGDGCQSADQETRRATGTPNTRPSSQRRADTFGQVHRAWRRRELGGRDPPPKAHVNVRADGATEC
jgi:hypothetical protein